jgi:serine/threonine-protein kinase
VKLSDFGIAMTEQDLAVEKSSKGGAPHALSPEQMDPSAGVDKRTDIYSMGVMLYGMLFAEWPFTGNTIEELMAKVKQGDYIKPVDRDPAIPASVNDLIVKMLAWNRNERFKDMHEVCHEVDGYLAQFSSRSLNCLKSALRASAQSEGSLDYHQLKLEDGRIVDLQSLGGEPV